MGSIRMKIENREGKELKKGLSKKQSIYSMGKIIFLLYSKAKGNKSNKQPLRCCKVQQSIICVQ